MSLISGTIGRITPGKSFGFVTLPSGEDIFFHRNQLQNKEDLRLLRPGDVVEFTIGPDPKNPDKEEAKNVVVKSDLSRRTPAVAANNRGRSRSPNRYARRGGPGRGFREPRDHGRPRRNDRYDPYAPRERESRYDRDRREAYDPYAAPLYDERPRFDERRQRRDDYPPRYDARPRFEDRTPRYDERPRFDDRPPRNDERPRFDDRRPRYGEPSQFNDRRPRYDPQAPPHRRGEYAPRSRYDEYAPRDSYDPPEYRERRPRYDERPDDRGYDSRRERAPRREEGVIKSINERGFGFIDGGGPKDIFFPAKEVVHVSFDELKQGDEVSFALGPDPRDPSKTQGREVRKLKEQGAVENLKNGFGFIQNDHKEKIFFHGRHLQGVSFEELKEGDRLEYKVVQSRSKQGCMEAQQITALQ